MNIGELRKLYHYNAWANRRVFDAISSIAGSIYFQDLKSSHGGIHGTLTHLVAAEKMWLSRWKGTPDSSLLRAEEVPTLEDLRNHWDSVQTAMEAYLLALTSEDVEKSFTMKTTSGASFTHTYAEAMQHLINHSTYHRGQLVTLMRQAGIQPPGTDLIAFLRQQQKTV